MTESSVSKKVDVKLNADVEKYIADLNRAASATERLAKQGRTSSSSTDQMTRSQNDLAGAHGRVATSADTAGASVGRLSKSQVAAAESAIRVTRAQNQHADAMDRVVAAERDLGRSRAGGKERDIEASELRLAKARRDHATATQTLDLAMSKASGSMDSFGNSSSKANKQIDQSALSFRTLIAAAAVLGPGLVPISGALIALAPAVAGFGAAGILAFVGIKKEMETGSQTGERYKAGLESLKGNMEALGVVAAGNVLGGFEESVKAVDNSMPGLNQQIGTMSTIMGNSAGPAVRGLLNLFTAMGPSMESVGSKVVSLSQSFERWSQTDSFGNFLSAAQAQLPSVGKMLGELGSAIVKLITAAAPMGGTVVTAITALSMAINAIPTEVLSTLIEVAIKASVAFKAWSVISGIMTRFGASTAGAAAGATRLGTSSAAAAAGMTAAGTAGNAAAVGVDRFGNAAETAERRSKFSGMGKVGIAALVGIGAAASSTGTEVENFGRSTAALEGDLLGAQRGGVSLDNVFSDLQLAMQPDGSMKFAEGLKSLSTAGQTTEKTIGLLATGFGTFGTGANSTVDALEGRMKSLGDALGGLVREGKGDQAAAIFKTISAEAEKAGMPISRLKELMPGYAQALQEVANKQQKMAQSAGASAPPVSELGRALAKLDADSDGLGLSMDKVGKAIEGLGGKAMGQRGATVQWGESLRTLKEALKESGGSVDALTEKGGRAVIAQNNLAQAAHTTVSAMAQNGASATTLGSKYMELRNSFIQANSGMDGGRAAATKLADSLGLSIPNIQTTVATLTKMGQAGSTAQGGLAGLSVQFDNINGHVASLNGKSVKIPASAPNAEQVGSVLLSINQSRVAVDGKSVTIPTSALGAAGTKAALSQIQGAQQSADGKSVTIPTSALNAKNTHTLLSSLSTAAVLANGKVVVIPTSTPNAAAVTKALNGISASAVTADSKSVTIHAASPMASNVTSAIRRLEGATVSADSKSVRVDTSSPNAANTVRQINGITQSARTADAASAYITVNTNAASARGAILGAMMAAQNKTVYITTVFRNIGQQAGAAFARADGGPAIPGAPAFASGGTWDARRGGRVHGAGSRTSDSVPARMTFGPASLSNYEHVWTGREVEKSGGHGVMYAARDLARQGRLQDVLAAGVRAGFADGGTLVDRRMNGWKAPRPAPVTVTAPSTGGAEVVQLTRTMKQLPGLVAQAAEVGTRKGASLRESDQSHELRRNLRMGGN